MNILEPYPKRRDKASLARETGLTELQVANWFINARVRFWRPLIERVAQSCQQQQDQQQEEGIE